MLVELSNPPHVDVYLPLIDVDSWKIWRNGQIVSVDRTLTQSCTIEPQTVNQKLVLNRINHL